MKLKTTHHRLIALSLVLIGVLAISFAFSTTTATAQSPLHPTFPFLDKDGGNVLESGKPVSTMQTCGQCHDTEFIAGHSFHADAGLSSLTEAGETSSGREWDTSDGLYGKWNPITYGVLGADLSTEDWLQTVGLRHVGGGPAEDAGIEMNCFLCHLTTPDNPARLATMEAGNFEWANTATLAATGIVEAEGTSFSWNAEAFDEAGELLPAYLTIQDPDNENCGQCHGTVHSAPWPVTLTGCEEETGWETATTGMVFSPQQIADSGMNLSDKEDLTRSWDVHMERLVECTDCHFSLNNPIFAQGSGADSLSSLEFDPRRLDVGEYLLKPLHQFARGQSSQVGIAPELKDTMRRCETCHNTEDTHDWLPYSEQHLDAIHCETCHVPEMYNSALQQVDWTVVGLDGSSMNTCRGVEGDTGTISDLVTGFSPTLLQRMNIDGSTKLAPYNLVSAWYWVAGDTPAPVPQDVLEEAFLQNGSYHPEILAALDSNGDGELTNLELRLDTDEKVALVTARLQDLGVKNPEIQAEVQPYSINHNVAGSGWAIQECETCHTEDSRLAAPVELASYVPGGVLPDFVAGNNTLTTGSVFLDDTGALVFKPEDGENDLYIFGRDEVSWVDWFGIIMVLGVLGGVSSHGGMRAWAARKRAKHEPKIEKIYMYTFYERVWHWLQTLTILILALTGLVIHKPEMFGFLQFKGVVLVHNIMAALLVANAILALAYNLISGDIKRFIPEPRGFFNQSIVQTKYYLSGIFKGDEHPFEKTRESRLNPLQKITYFGILNVLLPLQVITGALMWGAERWPEIAFRLGGLRFLAPFHTLVAWSFVAFIIAHVYLTTTGHTPMAGIKSMIVGWDEVEVHSTKPDSTEEE